MKKKERKKETEIKLWQLGFAGLIGQPDSDLDFGFVGQLRAHYEMLVKKKLLAILIIMLVA